VTDDIVADLRRMADARVYSIRKRMHEAADEIERLRKQVLWLQAVNTQMREELEAMDAKQKLSLEEIVLQLKAEADAARS
jgi:polyhydroxyalkanoate synthesis regulator phasin